MRTRPRETLHRSVNVSTSSMAMSPPVPLIQVYLLGRGNDVVRPRTRSHRAHDDLMLLLSKLKEDSQFLSFDLMLRGNSNRARQNLSGRLGLLAWRGAHEDVIGRLVETMRLQVSCLFAQSRCDGASFAASARVFSDKPGQSITLVIRNQSLKLVEGNTRALR
jgi:hypothetical protein